jgi:SOS-response transcriptional repressor LexA
MNTKGHRSGISDREILLFIDKSWRDNWTSPTVRELMVFMDCSSPSSALRRLRHLVRIGVLERRKVGSNRVLYRVPS